ncbi:hypothetical protein EDB80DRAFT_892444 [Ilyonectria destructans]|nr:hypothetical protein EDB80DRAFT_892444 [Ilyonectria destructans]
MPGRLLLFPGCPCGYVTVTCRLAPGRAWVPVSVCLFRRPLSFARLCGFLPSPLRYLRDFVSVSAIMPCQSAAQKKAAATARADAQRAKKAAQRAAAEAA